MRFVIKASKVENRFFENPEFDFLPILANQHFSKINSLISSQVLIQNQLFEKFFEAPRTLLNVQVSNLFLYGQFKFKEYFR